MRFLSVRWILLSLFALSSAPVSAQEQPFLFSLTFRGASYETNAAGELIIRPLTEETILQDMAADAGGMDHRGWSLVYHLNANAFGDTIDVVETSSGKYLDMALGFYFGSDLGLGRMAVTNANNTQERRVDQLYTRHSQFALGSAFLTKRFLTDAQGNRRLTVDADLHYLVRPSKTNVAPRLYMGTFTTTRPFRSR